MSKKIAEGTAALVLDVKVGAGAFMKDVAQARELSEVMVELGASHHVRTAALLTQMDVPLGRAAGNALEVVEAVEVLAGGGPRDVVELTIDLAREMLSLAGIEEDPGEALADGRAMDVWRRMVQAQGGDPAAVLPRAGDVEVVAAPRTGTVARLDAMAVGVAAWRLGAGRNRKEDDVSATAGVVWRATVGDHVVEGQPLFELHLDDVARLEPARAALADALEIVDGPVDRQPLVLGRVG
jgi:thymidine phosphorylase